MSDHYLSFALNAVLGCANFAFFWWARGRWRWFSFAAGCVGLLTSLVIGAGLYSETFGHCAGAPKEVDFHQGMTLCPGQGAHFTIQPFADR